MTYYRPGTGESSGTVMIPGPPGPPGPTGGAGVLGHEGVRGRAGTPIANYLSSAPPTGNCAITNMFWDQVNKKCVFEYDDQLGGSQSVIKSNPISGSMMITNVFFNPTTEMLVCEYEDET